MRGILRLTLTKIVINTSIINFNRRNKNLRYLFAQTLSSSSSMELEAQGKRGKVNKFKMDAAPIALLTAHKRLRDLYYKDISGLIIANEQRLDKCHWNQ